MPQKRRLSIEILIYVIGGFLTFFFGVIFVFISYPALNIIRLLSRHREAIVGFGLIIPTILASWLISLLMKYRGWKAFIPSLSLGCVIVTLVLICKKYFSWFPEDWLIFTPGGIILVIISAFLGGAFFVRGRTLIYFTLIFIVFYSLSTGLTLHSKKLSSQFHSYDIKIPGESVMLGATLTIPKSYSVSKWPGIVLIPGSGKQDRDETFGLFNATFKEIALFLSENGFVTIRYDKRGVGQSGGNFTSAGLYDFARDAESVFNYLKFISEIKGESEEEKKARFETLNSWAEKVRTREYKNYRDYFGPRGLSKEFQKMQKINPLPSIWMLQAMEYNQLKTLEKLKMPILAISGASDWLVPPSETKLLEQALKEAHHPDFEVKVFPDVDHHFIRVKSSEESYKMMSLYSIKDLFREYPINPPVLNKILNWLKVKTKLSADK